MNVMLLSLLRFCRGFTQDRASTDSPKLGLRHAERVRVSKCPLAGSLLTADFCSGHLLHVQMISGDPPECTNSSHC